MNKQASLVLFFFFFSLTFLSFVENLRLSEQEKRAIVFQMNNARRNTRIPAKDMKVITWDDELYEKLDALGIYAYGSENWRILVRNMERYLNSDQYTYLFHDTTTLSGQVSGILQFRGVRQRRCFNYTEENYCSAFCLSGRGNCNWFFQYYPVMVDSHLETIACTLWPIKGPYAPSNQGWSFWCFGRANDTGMKERPENKPYLPGNTEEDRCTACPKTHKYCWGGLCSVKPPPTTVPPTTRTWPITSKPTTRKPTTRKPKNWKK